MQQVRTIVNEFQDVDVRILIVQRSLSPPGGGNAVAAWMVHALAGEHDVAHAHGIATGRRPRPTRSTARRFPASG